MGIVSNLRQQMYRYRFEYLKDTDAYPRLITEHRKIFEGIELRDKDSVELAVQMHIAGQRKRVLDSIRRQ
ncbi:MAG: FCD domain-containing protein [Lachnospiraceae bacterium]|nr:FCD domain-containing protein [Lachnospiraceae bacterium]